MKKVLLSLAFMVVSSVGFAQTAPQEEESTTQIRKWLSSFNAVEVSGKMKLNLVKVHDTIAPKIVYDLKESQAPNFRVSVNHNGTLIIREKMDKTQESSTVATVYYNDIDFLKSSYADVTLHAPFKATVFDAEIQSNTTLRGDIDITDLNIHVSGDSDVKLEGYIQYLDVTASTSKFDSSDIDAMAVTVDATQSSNVIVNAEDRLVIKCATKATVSYLGEPNIVRTSNALIGGEIIEIK